MKKTILQVCLFGAAVLVTQGAMASGLKIRGGVTSNAYTLDITPATGSAYNYATSSFNGNNLGLTWLLDDTAYLDFAVSNGTGTWDGKYTNGVGFTSDMKRSDSAIVLGNNSANTSGVVTNVYVGWKTGETNLAKAAGASTNPSLDFKTNGFVFGGGWGFPLGGAGALGLSLGLGLMSGQYDSTSSGVLTEHKADMAIGFSYGLAYSFAFTKNFGASIDYKGNSYTYVYDSGLTTEWSLNEKLNTTGASLYLKF